MVVLTEPTVLAPTFCPPVSASTESLTDTSSGWFLQSEPELSVMERGLEDYLNSIGPTEFEGLVAEIWAELGYETEVTPGSRDRGIDVIATKEIPVTEKVLIQAKAYSQQNKVGSKEIRNYATLYQQEAAVDRVVVVTTGEFTSDAETLAKDLDVRTVDRDDLLALIDEAGIQIGSNSTTNSQSDVPSDTGFATQPESDPGSFDDSSSYGQVYDADDIDNLDQISDSNSRSAWRDPPAEDQNPPSKNTRISLVFYLLAIAPLIVLLAMDERLTTINQSSSLTAGFLLLMAVYTLAVIGTIRKYNLSLS